MVEYTHIGRHDDAVALNALEPADNGFMHPRENSNDAPLAPVTGLIALDAGGDPVAVHRTGEASGVYEYIGPAILAFGHHKTKAVGMAGEDAGNEVEPFGYRVPSGADLHQLAGLDHLGQKALEAVALVKRNPEALHKVAKGHGSGGIDLEEVEYYLLGVLCISFIHWVIYP